LAGEIGAAPNALAAAPKQHLRLRRGWSLPAVGRDLRRHRSRLDEDL